MSPTRRSPERTATLIVVAVCVGLVFVSATQLWIVRRAAGESAAIPAVLLFGAMAWLPWAFTAPIIIAVGRRHDFGRGRRLRSLAVHLPVFLLCFVPATTLLLAVSSRLFAPEGQVYPLREILAQTFAGTRTHLGLIVYVGILGLAHAMRTWQTLRERELEASRLETQAARARLEALSARLQPHFLFNTLHAIGALIEEDPARARTMIALLGDLLRDVIGQSSDGEVPLRVELDLLRRYLAIEQLRFADRLRVEISAAPETLERRVPRLLLQPLAENALRHGLAPRAVAGTLSVGARLEDGALLLVVRNDGVPLPAAPIEGVGLATTRERLTTRVPQGGFSLAQQDGWVEARIALPPRPGEPQ